MAGSRAAIRYAKALLSLATDNKVATNVNEDMKKLLASFKENPELEELLKNAIIKVSEKKEVLKEVFPKLNNLSLAAVDILCANRRIAILGDVAKKYHILFNELENKVEAIVITATPMSKTLEHRVLAKIKTLTDRRVELYKKVDQSILGGFILRLGDKQYDASILNNLNKIKRTLILN